MKERRSKGPRTHQRVGRDQGRFVELEWGLFCDQSVMLRRKAALLVVYGSKLFLFADALLVPQGRYVEVLHKKTMSGSRELESPVKDKRLAQREGEVGKEKSATYPRRFVQPLRFLYQRLFVNVLYVRLESIKPSLEGVELRLKGGEDEGGDFLGEGGGLRSCERIASEPCEGEIGRQERTVVAALPRSDPSPP